MTPPGLDTLLDGLPGFFESLRKAGFGIEPCAGAHGEGIDPQHGDEGPAPRLARPARQFHRPDRLLVERQQEDFAESFKSWVSTIEPREQLGPLRHPPADPAGPSTRLQRRPNAHGDKPGNSWLHSWLLELFCSWLRRGYLPTDSGPASLP